MKFKLRITLNDEEFEDRALEVAAILRQLTFFLQRSSTPFEEPAGRLFNSNGKHVGWWTMEDLSDETL